MNGMEITKQLKCEIDFNQTELTHAIHKHQKLLAELKEDPYNIDLQKEVNKAEEEIVNIGLEQKSIIHRFREEYKAYQKKVKANLIKNGIEEMRFNLTNALNRARKQNIVVRSTSANSLSDGSGENLSDNPSPEHTILNPLEPQDVTQSEFLSYFCLATHDVYKEMQNKRAERKRRSTANPHFLYGNKEWGFFTQSKRKRNTLLLTPVSPPNTRQSVRKKQERVSPPLNLNKNEATENGCSNNKGVLTTFPSIPNLPSGLIIERVSPGSASPDAKTCVICKQAGVLTICDICTNGFHVSCHNRPLTQTPHECPKCINKETRTVGALNVPSGMSVSCIPADLSEKNIEKKQLEEKKQTLAAELTELQNRHSQLTISLNDQKTKQEKLIMSQQSTEKKIEQILTFIETIKKPVENTPVES